MTMHTDDLQEMLTNVINEMENDNVDEYRQRELDMLYGALGTALNSCILHLYATLGIDGDISYILGNAHVTLDGYIYLGALTIPILDNEQKFQLTCKSLAEEKEKIEKRLEEIKKLQGES